LSRSLPRTSPSALRAALVVAAKLAAAALVTGCGASPVGADAGNTGQGKELFTQQCGACHVLADAGTAGTTGPNLDDGFGFAREDGFGESTFFEIVLEQMEIPAPPMPDYDEPGTETYLTDRERASIAAYVAEVAGKPSEDAVAGPQADDPKSIFTASCGSCHVLADAGTQGTVGPNLDEAQPDLQPAIEQITRGGGGMPAFGDQLSKEQIRALAEYVVESTQRRR
jgi:mono/diheme cytochrome c family protein